jgi:hypothetical protein
MKGGKRKKSERNFYLNRIWVNGVENWVRLGTESRAFQFIKIWLLTFYE